MKTAGLILAAGRSRRFGPENKLLALLDGQPLITYAANLMRALPLDIRLAVTTTSDVVSLMHGFDAVVNDSPEAGQGDSLALGVRAAQLRGADWLLVLLADMPFVTKAHCTALLNACRDDRPAASTNGQLVMPPVCFPASWFEHLTALHGDQGAGKLLNALPQEALIATPPENLLDIDTKDSLARCAL
ncbi:MAG: nucleotidyltransferase family protein [Cyanobacteria bacterium P01_H01_bin.58]